MSKEKIAPPKTIGEILIEVQQRVCDECCKWPEIYAAKYEDKLEAEEKCFSEKCDNCPLGMLD